MDPFMKHRRDVPKGDLKFFWGRLFSLGGFGQVAVNKDKMTFTFSDSFGKTLHTHTMFPRHLNET